MPTYTILCKDTPSSSVKETKVKDYRDLSDDYLSVYYKRHDH